MAYGYIRGPGNQPQEVTPDQVSAWRDAAARRAAQAFGFPSVPFDRLQQWQKQKIMENWQALGQGAPKDVYAGREMKAALPGAEPRLGSAYYADPEHAGSVLSYTGPELQRELDARVAYTGRRFADLDEATKRDFMADPGKYSSNPLPKLFSDPSMKTAYYAAPAQSPDPAPQSSLAKSAQARALMENERSQNLDRANAEAQTRENARSARWQNLAQNNPIARGVRSLRTSLADSAANTALQKAQEGYQKSQSSSDMASSGLKAGQQADEMMKGLGGK